jgi:ribonuclease HII
MCTMQHQQECEQKGFQRVVGVDECGNGCLAGPVTVCACYIPSTVNIPGINDSKKLSAKKREKLYLAFQQHPDIRFAVVHISPARIDEINILQARLQGMREAVRLLQEQMPDIDYVLVDGDVSPKFDDTPAGKLMIETVVGGDGKCSCIGAASIIAKVCRDQIMCEYEEQYPGYGFTSNKGYGSAAHMNAVRTLGVTPIHRKTFRPCSEVTIMWQPPTT